MNKSLAIPLLALFLTASATDASNNTQGSCDDPVIKGNLTTYNGEKIYHVPGGQFYDVTDAEQAGYRASLR